MFFVLDLTKYDNYSVYSSIYNTEKLKMKLLSLMSSSPSLIITTLTHLWPPSINLFWNGCLTHVVRMLP